MSAHRFMGPELAEDLAHRFAYHSPTEAPSPELVQQLHGAIRRSCHELARFISVYLPSGRERSVALTKIEEAMMWANASVARNQGAVCDGLTEVSGEVGDS